MITSDIQDRVGLIADNYLPKDWGAVVRTKQCRHGFKVVIHVNSPSGNELAAPLLRSTDSLLDHRITLVIDSLIERIKTHQNVPF